MTKEELIRYGKDYLHDLVTACCQISDIHKEFVRESLKALEQQPCDDCVSRQAVLDCLTATGLKKFDFILDAREKVNNLPPVTLTQCIAAFRFSKEDLIDICNERIEIECTHGTCKDCTNYVAGALDEEICLRGHELIHKDFYCADFEKRGGENGSN